MCAAEIKKLASAGHASPMWATCNCLHKQLSTVCFFTSAATAAVDELEEALVAQHVLFMHVLALPRGHQRAIYGAVQNVPSDVSSTVTPGQAGLICTQVKTSSAI